MKLHIVTVGEPKLAYARAGWQEYLKRLQHYHQVRITHIANKWAYDTPHLLAAADVPASIAFAFLDGDFYESILTSLKLVWPRMSPGGVVLIDDYQRPELPGVERAVHDFFISRVQPHIRVQHNIAMLRA